MTTPQWLFIGKLVRAHGVNGAVKVWTNTDFPEQRFAKGQSLTLRNPTHPEMTKVVHIATVQPPKSNTIVVSFVQATQRNDIEPFIGWDVCVRREVQQPLPPHEYYFHEIIGCDVFATTGEKIGAVTDILRPGANDVWVVRTTAGKSVYVPYIADVVCDVQPAQRRIVIALMEGLLE